jgi:hypothetical protein
MPLYGGADLKACYTGKDFLRCFLPASRLKENRNACRSLLVFQKKSDEDFDVRVTMILNGY